MFLEFFMIFFSVLIQLENLQLFNELNIYKQYMRGIEIEIEIEINKLNEIIYIQKKILDKIEVLINNKNRSILITFNLIKRNFSRFYSRIIIFQK